MAKLDWRKKVSGRHISAAAGDYHFHKSGSDEYTCYRVSPHKSLGIAKTVPEAMQICQDHHDSQEQGNDLFS